MENLLKKAISNANTIAISGHARPDGDCAGSCLGLYNYIREVFPEKEVCVYLQKLPEIFKFLNGSEQIAEELPENKSYDLFIMLDCGNPERLQFSAPLFESARDTLCIDHHKTTSEIAKANYVFPHASSTSELLYDLIGIEDISVKCAECLYMGMVHDTGIFRYSCTHPSTMRAAAMLMEKGINSSKIVSDTFDEKTYAQNRVLGHALDKAELRLDGKFIVSYLTHEELLEYGVTPPDLDGIASQLKNTKGIYGAARFYEFGPQSFKVSFRSNEGLDVADCVSVFGGGGHARAAGCTLSGTVLEVLEKLTTRVGEMLKGDN